VTNFQAFAQAIGVLSNLAVVITVFFILRQIKVAVAQTSESRAANKLTLWNTILAQAVDFYITLATSGLTEIYQKGRLKPDTLTEKERRKFFYLVIAWISIQENIFACAKTGYLDHDQVVGWARAFDEDLTDPGFQWVWKKEGHLFDVAFQKRVNATLRRINGVPRTASSLA